MNFPQRLLRPFKNGKRNFLKYIARKKNELLNEQQLKITTIFLNPELWLERYEAYIGMEGRTGIDIQEYMYTEADRKKFFRHVIRMLVNDEDMITIFDYPAYKKPQMVKFIQTYLDELNPNFDKKLFADLYNKTRQNMFGMDYSDDSKLFESELTKQDRLFRNMMSQYVR